MSQDAKLEHRLAAIMATDVVGYSQSMQADEAGTLAALGDLRQATENQVSQHRGRIANTAGDSVIAEFGSAVQAVSCAMALQQELSGHAQRGGLQLRIGIHLGDVVDKGGDLFGTAVNVAARLEGIAQPGSIVVSAAVREAILGKVGAFFTDLGSQSLKNLEEPQRAYAVSLKNISSLPGASPPGQALPLPNKPSIAVLPFENLSGDREQEYFADGMVEEIITELSRFRGLRHRPEFEFCPNLAWAWFYNGWVKIGEPDTAIQHAKQAMRLSPNDTYAFSMRAVIAYGHLIAGRFSEAVPWAEMAVRERPNHLTSWRALAASCALSGRQEQAYKAVARLRDLDPALRLSSLKDVLLFRRPQDWALLTNGLRQAGLGVMRDVFRHCRC